MVKSDTPGLKIKKNKDGSLRYYWEARTDAVKLGYKPSSIRLHYECENQRAARCRVLQAEMLAWLAAGNQFPARRYDGTIGSLAALFTSDEDSPYRGCKWNTQRLYDQGSKIIKATVGARAVRELVGTDFQRWHRNWASPPAEGKSPRLYRAKHTMDFARRIIAYGVTCGYVDCIRADRILEKLRFPSPPPRKEMMLPEHVTAIRKKAHEIGLPSVALATAFQFDLAMRQKDVIGEWLSIEDGTAGGIIFKNTRWANGLSWADIGTDMILRKDHIKTGFECEYDLALAPNVLAEIEITGRRVGPLIISETTGEPYRHTKYAETFRKVATAAGIPSNVWSMDARAGAISEAYAAGASDTDVQKHAGHTNPQTSARYNRSSVEQTRRAMTARLKKRIKNKA